MALCESAGCGCSGKKSDNSTGLGVKQTGGGGAAATAGFDLSGLALPFLSGGEKLAAKKLTRGKYEVTARVNTGNQQPISKNDFTIEIPVNGELKRVDVARLNVSAERGEPGARYNELKMVFNIIDNPIPIAFIIYGALTTAGLSAGGYFINSISRFAGSWVGQLAALAAIGAAGYTLLKK